MDFWKRLGLIATAVFFALWLVIVAVAEFGTAPPASVPKACITNCL